MNHIRHIPSCWETTIITAVFKTCFSSCFTAFFIISYIYCFGKQQYNLTKSEYANNFIQKFDSKIEIDMYKQYPWLNKVKNRFCLMVELWVSICKYIIVARITQNFSIVKGKPNTVWCQLAEYLNDHKNM